MNYLVLNIKFLKFNILFKGLRLSQIWRKRIVILICMKCDEFFYILNVFFQRLNRLSVQKEFNCLVAKSVIENSSTIDILCFSQIQMHSIQI